MVYCKNGEMFKKFLNEKDKEFGPKEFYTRDLIVICLTEDRTGPDVW